MKNMWKNVWKTCSVMVGFIEADFGSHSSRRFIPENSTASILSRSRFKRIFHNFTGLIITTIFYFYNLIKEEPKMKIKNKWETAMSVYDPKRYFPAV